MEKWRKKEEKEDKEDDGRREYGGESKGKGGKEGWKLKEAKKGRVRTRVNIYNRKGEGKRGN